MAAKETLGVVCCLFPPFASSHVFSVFLLTFLKAYKALATVSVGASDIRDGSGKTRCPIARPYFI